MSFVVTANEVFENRDFGRHFRDLPPTLILTATDNMPATLGAREGESLTAGRDSLRWTSRWPRWPSK